MIKPFFTTSHGVLYAADCLQVLSQMKSGVVNTVFADPPFNLGKDYKNAYNDKVERKEYLGWCREWILECCRVLKPGGAFFLYATPELAIQFAPIMEGMLDFRHWIALSMKGTFARGKCGGVRSAVGVEGSGLLLVWRGQVCRWLLNNDTRQTSR